MAENPSGHGNIGDMELMPLSGWGCGEEAFRIPLEDEVTEKADLRGMAQASSEPEYPVTAHLFPEENKKAKGSHRAAKKLPQSPAVTAPPRRELYTLSDALPPSPREVADKPFTAQADGRSMPTVTGNDHLIRLAHADALAIHLPQPGKAFGLSVLATPRPGKAMRLRAGTPSVTCGDSVPPPGRAPRNGVKSRQL